MIAINPEIRGAQAANNMEEIISKAATAAGMIVPGFNNQQRDRTSAPKISLSL